MVDFKHMWGNTNRFMSLFRCLKPVVVRVHGAGAIAGGSDIALWFDICCLLDVENGRHFCNEQTNSCDIVVMSETASIGYPPAKVWGCPTTAMWAARAGPTHAKRMLLTGDVVRDLFCCFSFLECCLNRFKVQKRFGWVWQRRWWPNRKLTKNASCGCESWNACPAISWRCTRCYATLL
jgi:hypothetical protein